MIEVIKTKTQYDEVLQRVTTLAVEDPHQESPLGRELEVLAVLIQDYERRAFPLAAASPIAAIRLRMDQLSLQHKDLVPFLGSRSRVSEVLSGKRPLSLAMIRALATGLDIRAESLLAIEPLSEPDTTVEWDRFPVKEMLKRGWFAGFRPGSRVKLQTHEARELLEGFFAHTSKGFTAAVALHKTDRVRSARAADRYALAAWVCAVRKRVANVDIQRPFRASDWNDACFQELRGLSRYDVGPRLAVQFLEERGIVVDVLPHLARTRLDGAAMLRDDGTPVIGLTIRHDRVDNFWFTLFHELVHVVRHLTADGSEYNASDVFLDDLDVSTELTQMESEADAAAREYLIPERSWNASAVKYAIAPSTVSQLAREVGVADAVVAGRVRFERKNFRLLSGLVGNGNVRSQFPEVDWEVVA
jgi:HTH-type transcriptional regulator / antitoxin HigA